MIGTGGKEVATSDILLDVEAVVPLVTGLVESSKAAMKKETRRWHIKISAINLDLSKVYIL